MGHTQTLLIPGGTVDIRTKPLNNRLAGLGDSITMLSGVSLPGTAYGHSVYINAGYIAWCWILPKTGDSSSEGKFSIGGVYGLTAQSIATIKTTYLPQVLAADPKPGICVVLAGTNDLADLYNVPAHMTGAVANLNSIYTQLLAAKILPVACGVPTIGVNNSLPNQHSICAVLNSQIEAAAAALKIPFIDFFPLTDDGDGWKDNYCGNAGSGDNHPSNVAARVMGQALRDYLDTYAVNFLAPNLVTAGNDATLDLFWQNGTFVDDANSDKIPDGGYSQSATAWSFVAQTDCAVSLDAEPGVVSGKWWHINKTAATTQNIFKFASRVTQILAGDHIGFGFEIKILNPAEAGVTTLNVADQSGNTIAEYNFSHLLADVAPFKFYHELIVPASVTSGLRWDFAINATGAMDFYIGQFTVRKI